MADLLWYAVRARVRSEFIAVASLRRRNVEVYCPERTTLRKYSDRVRTVAEPIFPGYFFARFSLSQKSDVLGSPAVEGIVTFGGRPASISASENDSVGRMVEAGATSAPIPKAGERVRVTAGPLQGLEGLLIREANKNYFVISMPLLQRSVSVAVERWLVHLSKRL